MEKNYKCPHCKGVLTQNGNIVFLVENENKNRALLQLSTRLGEYGPQNKLPFRFDVGDKFSFFCPLCQKSLDCERHSDLVKVEMEDDSGHNYEVCFSRVAGEESTYRIYGKKVESYGADAGKYQHIFKNLELDK